MEGRMHGTKFEGNTRTGHIGGTTPMMRETRSVAILAMLALALGAAVKAQTPNVVLSQFTQFGALANGGAFGSGSAAGTSMAVNSQGNVFAGTSYGGSLVEYNGTTGTETTLGSYSNIGPVAVDSANNLYIADIYSTTIIKLPFVSGAYPTFGTPSGTTPVCTGTDTAECTLATSAVNGPYGLASMVLDSQGNLFYSSTNGGSAVDHTIFEIPAASLASSTPTPKTIYTEPTNAAAPYLVGAMALDATGNLFFSDATFTNQGSELNNGSYVNELLYTGAAGTGYSATKTVLYSDIPASPGGNEITSVAVNAAGTVLYFATEYDGLYGFPMNKGVVTTTKLYSFATYGAKVMTTDGAGNFYILNYSNALGADAAEHVTVGLIALPNSNLGTSSSVTNVTTLLNDISNCSSSTISYAAAENGTTSTEFSAATNGSCATANISGASTFPTMVTFTPSNSGTRTGTLTATDANMSSGSATVTAIGVGSPAATPGFTPGTGTYTTIQSVTISDTTTGATIYYTTDGSTPTTASTQYTGPITVAATETIKAIATATGSSTSAVATATYTINLPLAATPVFTPAGGTYTSIQSVAISDGTAGATIYYTTDGTTPTAASNKYTGPITVAINETLQAIATQTGYNTSAVGTAVYVITLPTATPTFGPVGGAFNATQMVTISDTTPGATIYYTINGTTPTTGSAVYTGPISVTTTETIEAIATAPGYITSAVATATYTIALPTFLLAINPNSLTISASGGQGLANVTLTAENTFAAAVTFACSGLPTGATCVFSPITVTPSGIYSVTSVLSIQTAVLSSSAHTHPGPMLPAATLALALCLFGLRKRRGAKIALLMLIGAMGFNVLSGCSGSTTPAVASSTNVITVTATSGTIQQSGTLTLTIH